MEKQNVKLMMCMYTKLLVIILRHIVLWHNKTANRLSRHQLAVMWKIREVIGNSFASNRSLLRSRTQLAYRGELFSKMLNNNNPL